MSDQTHPLLARSKKHCYIHLTNDTALALVRLIEQSKKITGAAPSVSSTTHSLVREALIARGFLPPSS